MQVQASDIVVVCAISLSLPRMAALPGPSTRLRSSRQKSPHLLTDIEDLPLRFSKADAEHIRTRLLNWYDAHQRDLPWRQIHKALEGETSHIQQQRAYATWVSEIMLQQTRVATVVEYFNRWMTKWPTLEDLAAATEEEVNAVWAGLGYYRRARFLLEGAKQIMQSEQCLPSTFEELQKIRGIGKYTAGAIASIAFGQVVPAVDGNVVRVLTRLKAISDNPKQLNVLQQIWSLAEQLVDQERPGDFNQALMELGAMICTPASPQCLSCPIRENCKAFALSETLSDSQVKISVTDFPVKVVKASPRLQYVAVCVLENVVSSNKTTENSRFLLVKRPKTGLLAGLWDFPSANLDGPRVSISTRRASIDDVLRHKLGFKFVDGNFVVRERKAVGNFVHVFSHIHMHTFIEWISIESSHPDGNFMSETLELNGTKARWVSANEMDDVGLTSGVRKAFKMFLDFHNCRTRG